MERDDTDNIQLDDSTNFNSHAHVERDRWECAPATDKQNFNSHAHVERDVVVGSVQTLMRISTHTLTWSVTGVRWVNIL